MNEKINLTRERWERKLRKMNPKGSIEKFAPWFPEFLSGVLIVPYNFCKDSETALSHAKKKIAGRLGGSDFALRQEFDFRGHVFYYKKGTE